MRDHNTIARYESNPNEKKHLLLLQEQNGDMITPMGYEPSQLELHNIPSNLAVGDCVKNNVFNDIGINDDLGAFVEQYSL